MLRRVTVRLRPLIVPPSQNSRDLRIVFFSFWSNPPSDSFSNRIFESKRPCTTQAVTQPNGLQAYRIQPVTKLRRQLTLYTYSESIGILYLWRTRVMCGLRNSELSTCLFQFSHKTRQTMLLYAYFTPKVDFKRKFNHHQSFLYEWRVTTDSADDSNISNRTINTNRISNWTYDSKSNRITKLRRSLQNRTTNDWCLVVFYLLTSELV